MSKDEETGSPGWSASSFMQTTGGVAKAVVAAAAAATTSSRSPRPSVIFSSRDENGGKFQKLQHQVSRILNTFSSNSPVAKGSTYNPEVLTSQKRQWANMQLQYLNHHKSLKEPSRLFESMVVVGLHPHCDLQILKKQYSPKKLEGSSRLPASLAYHNHSRVEPILEPQVLFVYPPEKEIPIKYKDLVSFCFPGGLEVRAIEKTPSMSDLNEILLGQEHLKHSNQSFVFRLQGADNSILYGCCMLIEEIVDRPSGLLSAIASKQHPLSHMSRYTFTTRRCYCILSRLPFFELHFGLLNSIFIEERLERLTKDIIAESAECSRQLYSMNINNDEIKDSISGVSIVDSDDDDKALNDLNEKPSKSSVSVSLDTDLHCMPMKIRLSDEAENPCEENSICNFQEQEKIIPPNSVLSFHRNHLDESSDSSSSLLDSPCEDRNFRSDVDDTETEEASISGREDDCGDYTAVLQWAKENKCGSLQIICDYYNLQCPDRGSKLRFHSLDHLQPLEYHRPDEAVLHVAGSTIKLSLCSSSLELSEAQNALFAEEEASSLSTWAISCLCGSLRLEHILTIFAGVLLEKQIVVVSSNLGVLSALVLAVIPLIRPYDWQSLLMPVLPDDILDFLDAPVPYIVGVKNKTSEVQSKINSAILVDANKNQVKFPSMPPLPKYRELYSALSPFHSQLVGESFLAQKRPVYQCTNTQVDAVKNFLAVVRSYLNSLCSNLRSHTITNVQSNDDKVSLLMKESFIDSFSSRNRPFMKLFVDTQLFSVHTDLVLSFIQKE